MKADERLLEPGWGGLLTLDEALFIQHELRVSPPLRRTWHIRGKGCPLSKIAERAFPEKPEIARQYILNEQAKGTRHKRDARGQNIKNLASDEKSNNQDDTKVWAGQLILL